jgi:RimJ/RimL family protein N-acetyltransferase
MDHRVRPMEVDETRYVIDYFLGADPGRLPTAQVWEEILRTDFTRPLEERRFFYVVWEANGVPIGHSHVNDLRYGEEGYMHLHLWRPEHRRRGLGTRFVRESIAIYFEQLALARLFSQPYALNPAPNRTLAAVGFELVESYETVPGWINCRQPVNKWMLTRERALSLRTRAPADDPAWR